MTADPTALQIAQYIVRVHLNMSAPEFDRFLHTPRESALIEHIANQLTIRDEKITQMRTLLVTLLNTHRDKDWEVFNATAKAARALLARVKGAV